MKSLLFRAGMALLGVVVTLGWWSISGDSSGVSSVQGIPSKVWAGGAGKLQIEVDTTCAARFSVSFNEGGEDGRSLETWTTVPAGHHRWTIDVPSSVGGYIELGAESPKVGDRLTWKILVNGKVIDEQNESLDEELTSGYAFFLQTYLEDYSAGRFGTD